MAIVEVIVEFQGHFKLEPSSPDKKYIANGLGTRYVFKFVSLHSCRSSPVNFLISGRDIFTWPQLGPFLVPACPPLTAINGH